MNMTYNKVFTQMTHPIIFDNTDKHIIRIYLIRHYTELHYTYSPYKRIEQLIFRRDHALDIELLHSILSSLENI